MTRHDSDPVRSAVRAFAGLGYLCGLSGVLLAAAGGLGTGQQSLWRAALHLLVSGWATLMIFAVTYRTVPFFSGFRFPRPRWVWMHWYFSGAGAAGSAAAIALRAGGWAAALPAAAELVGALLFLTHIGMLFRRRLPASPTDRLDIPAAPHGPDRLASRFTRYGTLFLIAALALRLWLIIRSGAPAQSLPVLHLLLPGWVLLMIYGVAYHLLPRLAGHGLRSDRIVRLHATAATAGALGLSLTLNGRPSLGFTLSAALTAVGLLLFVWNILPTLRRHAGDLPSVARGFLLTGIASLGAGVVLGVSFAVYPPAAALRPLHATLNVLGGVGGFIFGMGYAVLPNLLGLDAPSTRTAPYHLSFVVVGLACLVWGTIQTATTAAGTGWIQVGAVLYGAGFALWAAALWRGEARPPQSMESLSRRPT